MPKEKFMLEAIRDAKRTGHHFGAVVIKGNKIIAKPGKRPKGDARYHAETQAILNACKKLKSKTLKDCTLYSTCEPCAMCFYMAWITEIPEIVYGSSLKDSIKAGFPEINVTDKFLNRRSGKRVKLSGRFMRDECLKLLKIA